MKDILVVYSSRTGNTAKVAEAICQAAPDRCELLKVEEVKDLENYKLIIAGYWVDKGSPCAEMKSFLPKLKDKNLGIFQTLGAEPKGEHALACLVNTGKLLAADTRVLGALSLRGAIDPKLIAAMSKLPEGHPHGPNPDTKARWAAAAPHPDAADLAEAKAFMQKLIALYDKYYNK